MSAKKLVEFTKKWKKSVSGMKEKEVLSNAFLTNSMTRIARELIHEKASVVDGFDAHVYMCQLSSWEEELCCSHL